MALPISIEKRVGDPVTVGAVTVTPEAQAIILRAGKGGMVYNRPVAVTVEEDGIVERVLVVDVTLVALIAVSVLTGIIMISISSRE